MDVPSSSAHHTNISKDPMHIDENDEEDLETQLSAVGENFQCFRYNHARTVEALTKFIVVSGLPFTMGEDTCFVEFAQVLEPTYKEIPKNIIIAEIIRLYEKNKELLIAMLTSLPTKVVLTCDVWARTICYFHISYFRITAHWIDTDWIMQKRVLDFFPLPLDEWTGDEVMEIAKAYGIDNKIFNASFDNASSSNVAIDYFKGALNPVLDGSLFNVHCICHVISLCVKNGLDQINSHIEKIRNASGFIFRKKHNFKQICGDFGLTPRKFPCDFTTRWDSTCYMLQACLPYKDPITVFINSQLSECDHLSDDDWYAAQKFTELLEVFEDASKNLSYTYHATTHLALIHLCNITRCFKLHRDDRKLGTIVKSMEQIYSKYYEKIPLLYCFATIMDPRGKLEGCENLITDIADNMGYDIHISEFMQNVKEKLYELYSIYEKSSRSKHEALISQSSLLKTQSAGLKCLLSSRKFKTTRTNDLDLYFEREDGPIADEHVVDFDILQWWKLQSVTYTVLSAMARDILTCPVSTMDSNSAFNVGGKIVDERRCGMSFETLQATTCLKDWLKAEKRKQGASSFQFSDDDDDDYIEEEEEE